MNPTAIALPNELREAYLSLLLHLPYEVEQATMVGLVARYQVGSASEHMMTVLRPTHKGVELLAAVATRHHYRLTPRLAYGVKQLVY